MHQRRRPSFDTLEGRSLCAVNGVPVLAVLGTGVNPVGILAGHVLAGADVTAIGQPGNVDHFGHDTITASVAERWFPGVAILPIVAVGSDGRTSSTLIAAAVDEAVALGADVISISFATDPVSVRTPLDTFDRTGMLAAFLRAGIAGVPVVVAAGNSGNDNDVNPVWPSNDASELPSVVSVAAVDPATGELSRWAAPQASNYGAKTVTLAAPGSDVPATFADGSTGVSAGTSMAAPEVAAVLARIKAARPTERAVTLVDDLRAFVTPTPGTSAATRFGGAILQPPAAIPPVAVTPPTTLAFPVHVPHPRRRVHHHPRQHRHASP